MSSKAGSWPTTSGMHTHWLAVGNVAGEGEIDNTATSGRCVNHLFQIAEER